MDDQETQNKDLNLEELSSDTKSESTTSNNTNQQNDDSDFNVARELEAIYNVPVQIAAVLGKATMQVSQLLKLGRGAVVELDRKVGEAIDIYVNDRLVARGEVVIMDEKLGITMTEIIKSDRVH